MAKTLPKDARFLTTVKRGDKFEVKGHRSGRYLHIGRKLGNEIVWGDMYPLDKDEHVGVVSE